MNMAIKYKASVDHSILKDRQERRMKVLHQVTASKVNAVEFLKGAGILNKSGKLSKIYR